MKRSLIVVAVALTAAGCGGTRTVTRTVTARISPPEAPVEIEQFGYIKSLTRKGAGFELRFDPALLLGGLTADRARREDSDTNPSDFYVVNEGHRLLTYIVPPSAHVTIVSNRAHGIHGAPITVTELARLVNSRDPFAHPLFEPIETGFWIRTHIDTVRSLDQQYFP